MTTIATTLVIPILSLVGVLIGLVFARQAAAAARQSAVAAEKTERAAVAQADAARAQAAAATKQLAIERARFHNELRPALEGRIKERPSWRGGSADTDHVLEVRVVKGPQLQRLTLHLPPGTHIGRRPGTVSIMAHDLSYPEVGTPTIGPGHPACWDVAVNQNTPTSFIASADCRDERGNQWPDVEVKVQREDH